MLGWRARLPLVRLRQADAAGTAFRPDRGSCVGQQGRVHLAGLNKKSRNDCTSRSSGLAALPPARDQARPCRPILNGLDFRVPNGICAWRSLNPALRKPLRRQFWQLTSTTLAIYLADIPYTTKCGTNPNVTPFAMFGINDFFVETLLADIVAVDGQPVNGQSCLMQDEPEAGACFSHKMSLKGRTRMLGIDHQHGRRKETEPGADPGVFGSQRGGAIPSPGPGGVIRLGESDPAPAGLRAPQARSGKGLVRRYMAKMTGLSRAQVARLIRCLPARQTK